MFLHVWITWDTWDNGSPMEVPKAHREKWWSCRTGVRIHDCYDSVMESDKRFVREWEVFEL